MAGKALGVIEVKSIGVLLQATDIMAKATDIDVVTYEKIGSGQVATFVRGDKQACETAIKAATEFVNKTARDSFVTAYVIPEPHEKLDGPFPIGR